MEEPKPYVGVPIKLLQQCEGHIIQLECKRGHWYEGKLEKGEINMNCLMTAVTVRKKNGDTCEVEDLYICGTQITLIVLPEALQKSFKFEVVRSEMRGRRPGTGRGKADILRAQRREEQRGRGHRDRPSQREHGDRPSRREHGDRPSRREHGDRPSRREHGHHQPGTSSSGSRDHHRHRHSSHHRR